MATTTMQRTREPGGPRRVPDCKTLRRLVAAGMTQQQIADWTLENMGNDVSRSAIGQAMIRCGLRSANPRDRYVEELPWRVLDRHGQHRLAKRLRLLGRENAGRPLAKDEQGMLRKFKEGLDRANASVHYDPDYPEGFIATPRREGETYVRYPDDWDGPRI